VLLLIGDVGAKVTGWLWSEVIAKFWM